MEVFLLHGDAPFGWQGFVVCALVTTALVIFFNEIARGALTKVNRKRRRYNKQPQSGGKRKKTSQTV
jgi:hypothetical protein